MSTIDEYDQLSLSSTTYSNASMNAKDISLEQDSSSIIWIIFMVVLLISIVLLLVILVIRKRSKRSKGQLSKNKFYNNSSSLFSSKEGRLAQKITRQGVESTTITVDTSSSATIMDPSPKPKEVAYGIYNKRWSIYVRLPESISRDLILVRVQPDDYLQVVFDHVRSTLDLSDELGDLMLYKSSNVASRVYANEQIIRVGIKDGDVLMGRFSPMEKSINLGLNVLRKEMDDSVHNESRVVMKKGNDKFEHKANVHHENEDSGKSL